MTDRVVSSQFGFDGTVLIVEHDDKIAGALTEALVTGGIDVGAVSRARLLVDAMYHHTNDRRRAAWGAA